jgi:hypothetical protein
MKTFWRICVGTALTAAVVGCGDLLNVTNENDPETKRVLATPADVEALIRGSFGQVFDPQLASDGINLQLATVAFENSAMAANFGMIERSAFPRAAIFNLVSDQFAGDYNEVWRKSYSAIRSASDGLAQFTKQPGFTLGSAAADARAKAFGKFVLGVSHATLAITYDQAAIYDETIPAEEIIEMVPYNQVMAAALGYIDEAIAIAQANPSITFPADWLGADVDAAGFIRVANSLKARYRTQVARTPAERQSLDWTKAIAEVDAGITSDFNIVDDDNVFDFWMLDYMSFKGAWNQLNYMIHGMADTSGGYQRWMSVPITARHPDSLYATAATKATPLIMTPDKRFPQGTTVAAQQATPGRYFKYKGGDGWVRAERGTWRWSLYNDDRFAAYYAATNTGVPVPFIKKSEMDLIKAEGLIRKGDAGSLAAAVGLINNTRVANGGLLPATVAGAPGGNACVPKLPNGTCGDLLETLKWEKRLENWMTVYGGWYFDSRGWGDLAKDTYLHYPVPARELEVRQVPRYTFGGGGQGSAPVGTYGY